MPVSYIPSAEQLIERQKTTARKRRRNQNVEIEELGALIPLAEGTGKQALDKISVLRLASTYMRFRTFVECAYGSTSGSGESSFSDLMSQAMDGFLLVLDKDGEILFASEGITEYVGLSQQDVVGQNLFDITQTDDAKKIEDCLKPSGTKPNQFRQFYIRFKSTLSPGRIQLSRFTAHTMVQVSGHLKVRFPTVKEEDSKCAPQPKVLGLVAECRLIESSPSILEISIPQSSFTSTINLNLSIVSVDTRVKSVIGFDSDDVVGTAIDDYFHPADWAKVIPCYKILLRTGHGVSRVFRFMTNTGEWVWIQMEGLVRYKEGTKEPQFAEITCKVVSQCDRKLKFIEQKELYAVDKKPDPEQKSLMNIHRDTYFMDQMPGQPCQKSAKPIVNALKETKISREVMDSVLHGRELAFQSLPDSVKYLAKREEVPEYERKIYEHYNGPFVPPTNSTPSLSSSDQTCFSPPLSTPATASDVPSPSPSSVPSVVSGTSQQYTVSTNGTANVPHAVITPPLAHDGTVTTTTGRPSNPNSPEGDILSVSSGNSAPSPSSPGTLGSPTDQSVCSPPSQAPSHLSTDTGYGSANSLFSPPQPSPYPEQQGNAVFSPTMPAMYPPTTTMGVFPVQPFQVPQTHFVDSNGVPPFYANPYSQTTMVTEPPQTEAVHPATNSRDIDPELDRILCEAMAMDSGVNSVSNGISHGGYSMHAEPAYPQLPAGNTITCHASASVFHPGSFANGHANPPPGSNEVQDILQQFL